MIKFPIVLFRFYSRMVRGKTLGARVAVFDDAGRVLLVKASYVKGWHLPGGGVDKGESLRGAALRELREEACVEPLDRLQLHGIFSNERAFRGDHVAVYVCRNLNRANLMPIWKSRQRSFLEPTCCQPTLTPVRGCESWKLSQGGGPVPDEWDT